MAGRLMPDMGRDAADLAFLEGEEPMSHIAELGLGEDSGKRGESCPLLAGSTQSPLFSPSGRRFVALIAVCATVTVGVLAAAAATGAARQQRRPVAVTSQDPSYRIGLRALPEGASCGNYGCQTSFVAELYCQCDDDCTRERNDCCDDFDDTCKGTAEAEDAEFQERPTAEAMEMARQIARTIMKSDGTIKQAPPEEKKHEEEPSADMKAAAEMLKSLMGGGDGEREESPFAAQVRTTTVATTTQWPYPSLFCWLVMRTQGYEVPLVRAQHANRVGIFDCDEYAVYSNGGMMQIENLMTIPLPAPTVEKGDFNVPGTTTDSWLNTLIFMEAWAIIVADGTWWNHEWTVKVDPDAVFFPDRLRELLLIATPNEGDSPRYIGNCDRSWHHSGPSAHLKLFGSLEIYSRDAVGSYKAFGSRCKSTLNWKGWGEDFFMQRCMEMLGALPVNGTSLLADKRCKPAPCSDSTKVAFHDFKDVQSYFDCWGQSRINAVSI